VGQAESGLGQRRGGRHRARRATWGRAAPSQAGDRDDGGGLRAGRRRSGRAAPGTGRTVRGQATR
jgi:hypothetical protein